MKTDTIQLTRSVRALSLVIAALVLSMVACSVFSSPEALNDGQGTRENPVSQRVYAKTLDFDVRALSVVWMERDSDDEAEVPDYEQLRVQLQIRCTKATDGVCVLEDIGRRIKLVDMGGILYEPIFTVETETPLEGEILGDAEKAGWLVYQIPRGVEVFAMLAEYGQEQQRIFFELP